MRLLLTLMIACVVVFAASGCTSRTTATASQGSATPVAPPTALPPVEAAPKATPPAWIDSVSPLGEAKDGAQIRVRFKNDLVPIEALESSDRAEVLTHFVLQPALPGRFIILTPKMVGFEADAAIPHAARIKVTLTAGLADRSGNTLASDYSWSFTSTPLTISNLPGSDGTTQTDERLTPTFAIETSDFDQCLQLVEASHARAACGMYGAGWCGHFNP